MLPHQQQDDGSAQPGSPGGALSASWRVPQPPGSELPGSRARLGKGSVSTSPRAQEYAVMGMQHHGLHAQGGHLLAGGPPHAHGGMPHAPKPPKAKLVHHNSTSNRLKMALEMLLPCNVVGIFPEAQQQLLRSCLQPQLLGALANLAGFYSMQACTACDVRFEGPFMQRLAAKVGAWLALCLWACGRGRVGRALRLWTRVRCSC